MASRPTQYTPAASRDESAVKPGSTGFALFKTAFAGLKGCRIRLIKSTGDLLGVKDTVLPWPLKLKYLDGRPLRIAEGTPARNVTLDATRALEEYVFNACLDHNA